MLRRLGGTLAALALITAASAARADALVSEPRLLDGPSADLLDVGGVAMAEDGTGGVVYRKLVDGRAHVFASQFLDGHFGSPQRVDAGQRFDSTWPAIGAADGGRLVVVWVQEFGVSDRLFSASLQPGARRFQPPVPVDLDVGDSAQGIAPQVSLNRGGQGYVAYRVVTDPDPATAPPGYVLGDVRMARYNGDLWSTLGTPVNRSPGAPLRDPARGNGPQVRTNAQGSAVVAWQESDDELVDRVYARRVFGLTTGIPLQVSPSTFADRPLRAGADRFSLDAGVFGNAAIVWRQAPAQGGALAGTRLLLAQSPDVFSPQAAGFGAPRIVDGLGAEAVPATAGAVNVSVSQDGFLAAFGVDASARATGGDETAVRETERLDATASSVAPDPLAELGESGAAAYAWKVQSGARGSVAVRERRSDGVPADRMLSGPRGGAIGDLAMAGSGLGDALVGFLQGSGDRAQLVTASVDAPPDVFNVQTPIDWVRGRSVELQWDRAPHAIGGVEYTVTVDDDEVRDRLRGTRVALPLGDLDDGVRTVQVIARDPAGQETTSVAAELKLDRRAPRVRVTRRGRRVTVRVDDRGGSGVDTEQTAIAIGNDRTVRGRGQAGGTLPTAGRFRVLVRSRDNAGNRTTVRRLVVVR